MSDIDRDVSLALAFLIAHQDEWKPEMVIARSVTTTSRGDTIASSGGVVIVPVTLVGVVR